MDDKGDKCYNLELNKLHDPYTDPISDEVTTMMIEKRPAEKTSVVIKLLVVACVANFVLILATAGVLSYFLARTATKSEVGAISQELGNTGSQAVGPPGEPGKPGAEGSMGVAGPMGMGGDPGPMGFNGTAGSPGEKGDMGVVGPAGLGGDPGLTGSNGTSGPSGEKGDMGVAGPMGLGGDPGPTGSNGTAGPTGEKGDMGTTGPPGTPAATVGGVSYNRWGNSNCRTGADRVYAGRTGSSLSDNTGGASNIICMPDTPEYPAAFHPGVGDFSSVDGTEYEIPLVAGRDHHNSACAVCYLPTQNTVIMIPARTTCPSGWTMEYLGFLMSEARLHQRTQFTCVDGDMESVPGLEGDIPSGQFYHVEARCSGMACPPYIDERELGCVVCSR